MNNTIRLFYLYYFRHKYNIFKRKRYEHFEQFKEDLNEYARELIRDMVNNNVFAKNKL